MRDFDVDGHRYCCMEQYMMSKKTVLFKDFETMPKILNSNDQATIKKLGREVRNFDSATWDKHKFDIVVMGNIQKFSQKPDLEHILLATGNKTLVEASPYDRIWGIVMRATDPRVINPNQWEGQNLLGKALMEVRKILKEQSED